MEHSRQDAFRKLREPCVELSAVGLKFRGHQASPNDLLNAIHPVYDVVNELASTRGLDEKLAEYAFFPLAHIFNEVKRAPVNVLELSVKCLQILVAEGWRARLSPQLGKQLIILLTLIVGGAPSAVSSSQPRQSRAVELDIAGFNCLAAIFNILAGEMAEKTIYNEIGTATVVDQTVYILLEGVVSDRSDDLCISAARSLQGLYQRITDRVVLASIMPRTVSALVQVLQPTTQIRRSYKLICICLNILADMLKAVLNDQANADLPEKVAQPQKSDERLVLDESWLRATATQIKLALTNVIRLRRHERPDVREELLKLCVMVIEDCRNTLHDSIPILVETTVVLSDIDEDRVPNKAYSYLKHLATAYSPVLDSLRDSLHTWLTAFPRTMQSNDETKKQWALKQISTAFQILAEIQSSSDILTSSLTSGLCDSVAAIVNNTSNHLQLSNLDAGENQTLQILHQNNQSMTFLPVLLDHRSQQQTLKDLQAMITRLNISDYGNEITRLIVNRIHQEQGKSITAPLWLATAFLKNGSSLSNTFDEFISSDHLEHSGPYLTKANMTEELYYISLPILNETLADESRDWRVSALTLEAIALQAEQLGDAFRPELMDALYPVLQLLASKNPALQKHSMTCLNILTRACNYADTSTMIIENVDYLVNSVALKLNTFDVSPYPPQVLLMMVKLCGGRLIPYLDDLVDSIFGILDLYHGYPKLVEMMFKTLASIVEESTKNPALLAIDSGKDGEAPDHFKKKYQGLLVSTVAEDLAHRKLKRTKYSNQAGDDEGGFHPNYPWSETSKEKNINTDSLRTTFPDSLETDESEEPLPPPRETEDGEKSLSKSHTLMIHIVKSIPPHLSSPSPYLRKSLLSILIDVLPVLAADENSFLPLVNDLWPSILARISFPLSYSSPGSSTSLIGKDAEDKGSNQPGHGTDSFDFQEETFVTTTACRTVEIMLKNAGDFMASRVESEFSRWERMYRRAWEKVRQDTDKVIERRAQQQSKKEPSYPWLEAKAQSDMFSPGFTQSLALTKPGTASGSRAFTPHHDLWRAFTSLFLTLLTHVRLSLSTGDRICELLGEWVTQYAGPTYYFSRSSTNDQQSPDHPANALSEADSVESVIQAMEIWNPDLTWFIFQQQKSRILDVKMKSKVNQEAKYPSVGSCGSKTWSFPGGQVGFAELMF